MKPEIRILSVNPRNIARFFEEHTVVEKVKPPIVVRLDGVGFGKSLKDRSLRDPVIHRALVDGCRKLMKFFNADFCHVVSDEVNLYMFRYLPYGGRAFKIVSISSAILSSFVSLRVGLELYFDSRLIILGKPGNAVPYLLYRARVGYNNFVSKLYTTYISSSTKKLSDMIESLTSRGVDISLGWRSTGSCLFIDSMIKESLNPITGNRVAVIRRITKDTDDMNVCLAKLIDITRQITYS